MTQLSKFRGEKHKTIYEQNNNCTLMHKLALCDFIQINLLLILQIPDMKTIEFANSLDPNILFSFYRCKICSLLFLALKA